MDFFDRLQTKSSDTRARYAFGVAGIITGLIAVVWGSTIPARFAETSSPETVTESESNSFTDLLTDAKAQLGNIIEGVTDTPAPEEPVTNMGALNMDEVDTSNASPSPPENALPQTATHVQEVVNEPQSTTTADAHASTSAPRVILIATTTSQTSE